MTRLTQAPAPAAALDLDGAVGHVLATALRAGPVGAVGLELEHHLADLAAPARRVPWERVRALVDGLPQLPGGSRVTLEPGGQVELSGPPGRDAVEAVTALRADRAVLGAVLAADRLGLAPVGADPVRVPRRESPGTRSGGTGSTPASSDRSSGDRTARGPASASKRTCRPTSRCST